MADSEKPLADATEDAKAEDAPAPATEENAEPTPPPTPAEPDPEPSYGPSWLPLALAAGVAVLFFLILPPLTKSGLWDPYELNVADLSRRIALNLHGASSLALEATDNSLPHLNDLGRPQLPFTSIALGFKFFGLHEWAGRLPLAAWGLVGVLVTYGFVSRLVDRRAGLFSAVALTTMPLYFVHARTMLGDIVMMTAFAMIFGGFSVGIFGARSDDPKDGQTRALWSIVAIVGCLAGFFTRGAFIGVGVPALAVAGAYAITAGNGQRFDSMAHGLGVVAGAVGLVFCFLGLRAIGADKVDDQTVIWAGAILKAPNHYPTFDFMVGHVAPSLAPWSAFAPFAVGRLFSSPARVNGSAAFTRESQARLVLLVGTAAVLVAHGWMAAKADLITFSGPAVIAAMCGIALRDYERGAHPSLAVGVGTAVLLGCMHHELHNLPAKAFQAFSVAAGATFPESFKAKSIELWTIVLVGFAGISVLTWVERDPDREPFEPKGYLKVVLALRDAWDGMLALAYFAIVAGASLAGLAVWFGTRQHAKWLPTLSSQMRELVLNAWWLTAFAPLALIFAVYFWSDVWVWAFDRAHGTRRLPSTGTTKERLGKAATRGFEPFEELAGRLKAGNVRTSIWKLVVGRLEVKWDALDEGVTPVVVFLLVPLMYLQVPALVFVGLFWKLQLKWIVAAALAIPSGVALFLVLGFIGDLFRGSRAAFLVVFGVTVGAVLCFSFYPALANQLSPKEIFESYQRMHKGNEPLALFGVGGRTAAYYAGGQPIVLKDTTNAYEWLAAAEPGSRRFAAVRAEELPRLNRTYRERTGSGQNLPVLDARSSQIILVGSSLEDSEKNQNPLGRILLSAPPKPQRKVEANFEDKFEVLGFDIIDATGRNVEVVAPGKKYHMRTYFKVLQSIGQEWQMFIHIDGFHRRHNGDHQVCEGKYPMSYWLKDDLVMDDHEFSLEPNFSPGPYTLYFGFFIGETRLKIKSGPGDNENRVNGGALRVQ